MAVVYAVKNGNWSDTSTWNTGALPQPGDTVCANNYTVTIDQDVDLWVSGSPAGIITTRAYSPAVAGGGFTCARDNTVIKCQTIEGYTTTLTITANNATIYSDVVGSNHASTQNLYAITFGGAGTLQIYGNVTGGSGARDHYGVHNNSSGTISITGNVTGGSFDRAYGVNNSSSGTISITGNVTGGSGGAVGVNNNSSGTISITGNVTGGPGSVAYGVNNYSTGTINITGNVTGGSGSNAYGVNNGSTGIVNVTGTSHYGKAAFAFYSTANGTLRVVGDLYADPSPAVYWTGSSAYCAIDGNEYGGISGAAQGSMAACVYKRAQPQAKNRFIRVAEADSSLSGYSGQAGYFYGALYGTLGLPSEEDVREAVVYGPSSELTGTCAVPPPQSVLYGVPVDDTVGTAAITAEAIASAVWDALRSEHTGTGTFGAVSEWSGGGGTADWTDDEKKQIRYRLGIDGDTAVPTTNSPHLGTTYGNLDQLAAHGDSEWTKTPPADIWTYSNRTITGGTVDTVQDKDGYTLSSAGIDAIWDEAQSGHTTAGTFGAYLNTQISSRAPADTALSNLIWTNDKASYLDAAISSRLATSDYVPPDNASIAAIKSQTDKLSFVGSDVKATLDNEQVTVAVNNDKTGYSLTADYNRAKTALAITEYIAPDNASIAAIKSQTDKLQFDSNNYVYAVGVGGGGGTDWTDDEKKQIRYRLGIDGTTTSPQSNTPHLGSTYSTLDDLAAHVSTRLAASDYVPPDNASISEIKTQTDKLTFNTDNYVYAIATNATTDWTDNEKQQIRYRLGIDGTTETPSTNTPHLGSTYSTLDDLAAHVSTRLATSDYVPPDNASISAIKTKTDKLTFDTNNYVYSIATNASTDWTDTEREQIRYRLGIDGTTQSPGDNTPHLGATYPTLDSLGSLVSTRLAAADYTPPDNVSISAIKTKTDRLTFNEDNYIYAVGVGGGGGTDWTDDEKKQIRYRLGVDGDTQTPSTNVPHLGSTYSTLDDVGSLVASRLAAEDYVAPDNASILAIKDKTDKLQFNTENAVKSTLSGETVAVELTTQAIDTIIDNFWDEPTTDHTVSGSFGALVSTKLSKLSFNPDNYVYADIGESAGIGSILIDHNYGGTDNLRYVTPGGNGIANGIIKAYLKEDYEAGRISEGYIKGETMTASDGRWRKPLALDPNTYILVFYKPGEYGITAVEVTISRRESPPF